MNKNESSNIEKSEEINDNKVSNEEKFIIDEKISKDNEKKSKKMFLKTVFKKVIYVIIGIFAAFGILAFIVFLRSPADFVSIIQTEIYIDSNYIGNHSLNTEIQGMNKGLVESLGDKFSAYYSPNEYKQFNNFLSSSFVGIGATFKKGIKGIEVISVLKDSPGKKAGLKSGDTLIGVNGKSIENEDINSVMDKIKGKEKSKVNLEVLRSGKKIYMDVTLGLVNIPTVYGEMLSGETLYLGISSFGENTGQEFEKTVNSLTAKKPKKIILDLRGNGGGSVLSSLEVAEFLVDKGPIMYTKSKDQKIDEEYDSTGKYYYGAQVVVLVDGNTASASEILAGGVKGRNEGIIMGQQTYGKGVIQTVYPTANGGAAKITTSSYLTSDKLEINKIGIKPDILLNNTDIVLNQEGNVDVNKDPTILKARQELNNG